MLVQADFLLVDSVLVRLVEVSLLAKVLPGRFGLIGNNIGLRELNLHIIDFLL